ncbi:Uncharacterised protein [Vibrio cholerae]|nr:Uncharacterised protein [Vibrio cholerae]
MRLSQTVDKTIAESSIEPVLSPTEALCSLE